MIDNVRIENDKVLVRLQGKIYVEQAAEIRETLLDYIEKGKNKFVIDFSGVDYIDSSGLGVLVAVQKRALQHGGSVCVSGLKGVVKELFELTRLVKVFEIV